MSAVIHDLCVTDRGNHKMVHHEDCRHANPLQPYLFARHQSSPEAFADALIDSGAIAWHAFCADCCADITNVVWDREAERWARADDPSDLGAA